MKSARSSLILASAAVLGLAACASNPSPRAVAEDVIEELPGLSSTERSCLLNKLDSYPDETLEAIGEANETVNFSNPDALEATDERFQEFVDDLSTCTESG